MEQFGICVVSTTPDMIAISQQMQAALTTWNIAPDNGTCELTVRIAEGGPAIVYNPTGGWMVRRAAHLLAQVTKWRLVRVLSGIPAYGVELQINRAVEPSPDMWKRIAWALFLWAALEHADHPMFEPFYLPKNPPVLQALPNPPARPIIPAVTRSATAVQPLPRPHYYSPMAAPAPLAPTPPARRRG